MSAKRRRLLVIAVHWAADQTDDPEDYPFTDEEFEELEGYDNCRIGSEERNGLARLLREIRRRPAFLATFRRAVRSLREAMYKSPSRYRSYVRRDARRLYPVVRTRGDRPAKIHRDCAYCGVTSHSNGAVCGRCKAAGIDGPVIRGTEARKGGTYTVWLPRKKGE